MAALDVAVTSGRATTGGCPYDSSQLWRCQYHKVIFSDGYYMYIPGINGTASGSYEKWIEFEGFSVAAGRDLPLVTPGLNGRGLCVAKAGEFMISKAMDASTPLLFQQACSGAAVSQVQLDLCEQTPKGLQPYAQYTLENVIFSQSSAYWCNCGSGDK